MKNKILTMVFALSLAAFVLLTFFPAGKNGCEGENRELASMPELSAQTVFSGEFAKGFESFIDDHIGFRSFFTSLSEKLNAKKGIKTPAGRLVYTDTDIGTGQTQKTGFLIVNDSIFEMFRRNLSLEEEYAAAINHYADKINDSVTIYAAVIPTALEFEEPIYSNTEDNQKEAIDYMEGRLSGRVKTVDIYSSLLSHKDEYIFFRTDHHWTQLGAYYGYEAFCAASGNTPVALNAFERNSIPGFLGSLYKQTSAVELTDKPDTIEWYDTTAEENISISMRRFIDGREEKYSSPIFNEEYSDGYRFFLSGDNPFVELTNKNNPTGKTIVIVRDSFANAFAPWIIENYKKVILIDPRSYKEDFSVVLGEFKPDEVLIMSYIFSAAFDGYGDLLTDLYRAP